MAYRLLITQDIKKQLGSLPGNLRGVARQCIADLANNPRPPQSKELKGHSGHYRLHIATKYRVVWQIFDDDNLVEIEYVGIKSRELYKSLDLERLE